MKQKSDFSDVEIIEEYFPNWKTYLPLFEVKDKDSSSGTYTRGGIQVFLDHHPTPLYKEYTLEMMEFCQQVFKDRGVNKKLVKIHKGWTITYGVGGYQEPHTHALDGGKIISTNLLFDEILTPVFFCGGYKKERTFQDSPGVVRIFNSHDVYHGALPTPSIRRLIVQDYSFDYTN